MVMINWSRCFFCSFSFGNHSFVYLIQLFLLCLHLFKLITKCLWLEALQKTSLLFPHIIYSARKHMKHLHDNFVRFVVCPACHALYPYLLLVGEKYLEPVHTCVIPIKFKSLLWSNINPCITARSIFGTVSILFIYYSVIFCKLIEWNFEAHG